jgi:hypothetical protein
MVKQRSPYVTVVEVQSSPGVIPHPVQLPSQSSSHSPTGSGGGGPMMQA